MMQTSEGKDFTLETGKKEFHPVPHRTCNNIKCALMPHGPGRFGVTAILLERRKPHLESGDFKCDSFLI